MPRGGFFNSFRAENQNKKSEKRNHRTHELPILGGDVQPEGDEGVEVQLEGDRGAEVRLEGDGGVEVQLALSWRFVRLAYPARGGKRAQIIKHPFTSPNP